MVSVTMPTPRCIEPADLTAGRIIMPLRLHPENGVVAIFHYPHLVSPKGDAYTADRMA
jgi:hypothetical protein